jgi:hypothetical protein
MAWNSIEVTGWQKIPDLAAIVRATFPQYKRRIVTVRAAESVTLHGLNWSGGSRSEYVGCTLDAQATGSSLRYSALAPWVNHAEGASVPIPPGMVMVEGGTFCGKPSLLRITVNPADMPKFLSGPAQSAIA